MKKHARKLRRRRITHYQEARHKEKSKWDIESRTEDMNKWKITMKRNPPLELPGKPLSEFLGEIRS